MRINQFVAASSGLSRRAADTAISDGRVAINGRTATLGATVNPQDIVTLDGATLTPAEAHTYVLLHKPAGYVSSRARQGSDPTLYELLPEKYRNLRIAGRLDRDSSGLILLTDDGPFVQTLTHPGSGKTKRYEITLQSPISPDNLARLETGVQLTDGLSQVKVIHAGSQKLTVELSEGRNRQLRRTFGALGYTVLRLHRTAIGHFKLDKLPPGHWMLASRQGILA